MSWYWMETLLFSIIQKSLNNTHNRINTYSIENGLRWEVCDQHKDLSVKNVVECRDEVRSLSLALLQTSANPLSLIINKVYCYGTVEFSFPFFQRSPIYKSSTNASQRIKPFFLPAVIDFIYFSFICWNPQAFIAQGAFLHLSSVLFLVGTLSLDLEFKLLAFLPFHASVICQVFNFEAACHKTSDAQMICTCFMFHLPSLQWDDCMVESFAPLKQSYDSNQNSPLLTHLKGRQGRHSVARISEESQQVGAASSPFPVVFLTFFSSVCDNFSEKIKWTKHYNAA